MEPAQLNSVAESFCKWLEIIRTNSTGNDIDDAANLSEIRADL